MIEPDWNRDDLTFSGILSLAMKVETKEEASKFIDNYTQYLTKTGNKSVEEAREVAEINVGYWTGYMSNEVGLRVLDLYDIDHPYFGRTRPSPQEALKIGYELARKMR